MTGMIRTSADLIQLADGRLMATYGQRRAAILTLGASVPVSARTMEKPGISEAKSECAKTS
jgi:hypothetical protein